MKNDKLLNFIHLAWLIPVLALGITTWCKLIISHNAWQDYIVIISSILIVIYWMPLALNWGGFMDSFIMLKQSRNKNLLDAIQYTQYRKRLRIIGILISISFLMIAASRIVSLILGNTNG